MGRVGLFTVFLAATANAGSAQTTPEVVGPGLISTAAIEYGPAVSPDGTELWFTRRNSFSEPPQVLRSRREGASWSAPEPSPFSHPAGDEFPSFSPDGTRLYFASARPVDGVDQAGRNDIWYVEREGDGWSPPVHVGGPMSTTDIDSHPVETTRGLFFHSRRPGSRGVDAFWARGPRGNWGAPEPLPFNSDATDGEVSLSGDGDYAVFYSDREGGHGRGDLYYATFDGNRWSAATNLGPGINSEAWEWSPSFDAGGALLFARLSEDGSDSDLYRVTFEPRTSDSYPYKD